MATATINPTIVGEAVGVSELYIAKLIKDDAAGYSADTPEILAPMATVARETSTNSKTRYYSDKAMWTDVAEGETKLTIAVPGLTVHAFAETLGKHYDATKGKMYDDGSASDAPYYALGYAINRPDGVQEFHWFLKGKVSIPKDEGETRTDSINEKTLTLEFTAVTTVAKFQFDTNKIRPCKHVAADTTDTKFNEKDTWFTKVQTPPAVTAA